MPVDRQTLAAEVIYAVGNRTDLSTEAINAVRRGYQILTQSIEFPEAFTTVTINSILAVLSYALPTNYFSIYGLRNKTADNRLIQLATQDYRSLDESLTGAAKHYSLLGRTLYIHPAPSAAEELLLDYRRNFVDLSADTSVHELPDAWEEALIYLSSSFLYDLINEHDRAVEMQKRVAFLVRSLQRPLQEQFIDRIDGGIVVDGGGYHGTT